VVEFQPLTPAELSLVTQEWTGLAISPEAAEMLCRLTLADFRYLVGYLLELERACAVNQANEISMALLEALAKKQNRKRDAAARFQVGDNKRLRVAGRESVQ